MNTRHTPQKKRGCIKFVDLIAAMTILYSVLGVPYLNHLGMFRQVRIVLLMAILGFEIVSSAKVYLPKAYRLLIMYFGVILMVTIVKSGSLLSFISTFGPVICFSLLCMLMRSWNDCKRILNMWTFVYKGLLFLDIASIILYPNGLYVGTYVHNNWFLGYKTSRLEYTFVLMVFLCYVDLMGKKRITVKTYLYCFLVLLDAYLCQGTGVVAVTLVYVSFLIIMFTHNIFSERTCKIVRNYHLFIYLWLALNLIFVFIQYQPIIQKIIYGMLGKQYSYGERILIWNSVLVPIKENLLLGVGALSSSQTAMITGGFTNAHNMVYTYLLTGGLITLIILFCFFYLVLKESNKYSVQAYSIMMYFYCIMFLGITSSSLAYSPIFFFLMCLPINRKIQG